MIDVHGNMFEWCWDWYQSDSPVGMVTDYAGVETGSHRVIRSDGWGSVA